MNYLPWPDELSDIYHCISKRNSYLPVQLHPIDNNKIKFSKKLTSDLASNSALQIVSVCFAQLNWSVLVSYSYLAFWLLVRPSLILFRFETSCFKKIPWLIEIWLKIFFSKLVKKGQPNLDHSRLLRNPEGIRQTRRPLLGTQWTSLY